MSNVRIEVYQATDGSFHWACLAANNEIVCQGEGHTTEHDARRAAVHAAELMETAVDEGNVVDEDE